jgi:hypothetical protein
LHKRPVRNGLASKLRQLLVSILLVNKRNVMFRMLRVIFVICVSTLSSKQHVWYSTKLKDDQLERMWMETVVA